MPSAPFLALDTDDALDAALNRSTETPVVLFKHSATCPLSAYAHRQMKKLSESEDPPVYKLVVQESRALSDAIAERFGIRHESPQAIIVYDHTPVYDASHMSVSASAIRQAISEVTAS